jgi:hypothetical protein
MSTARKHVSKPRGARAAAAAAAPAEHHIAPPPPPAHLRSRLRPDRQLWFGVRCFIERRSSCIDNYGFCSKMTVLI